MGRFSSVSEDDDSAGQDGRSIPVIAKRDGRG